MTRKDYILFAENLRSMRTHRKPGPELDGYDAATRVVTFAFASDNPRFNAEHFQAVVRGERELTSRPPR